MKRLLLVLLAVAAFAPATAQAASPCRDRIYNDWYADGKIGTDYSLSCYRDALKHVPADARTYSSLADDIRSAMQAAQARAHGTTTVPAQVGKGGPPPASSSNDKTTTSDPTNSDASDRNQQVNETLPTAAASSTSSGSGVPVPLIVLGGLALLLVAVGGVGMVAKRRRS